MIKVTPDLRVSGDLFAEYRGVKNLPFLYQVIRRRIQAMLETTLGTATALNIIVRVTEDGIDLIDNTNNDVGVFTSFDSLKNCYVMRSKAAFATFAIASVYAAAANIVSNSFQTLYEQSVAGDIFGDAPVLSELTVTQPTTLTGVAVTSAEVSALGTFALALDVHESIEQPTEVTGVVLSDPSVSTGTYTLAYTAKTLGTLTNVTGVTVNDVKGVDATGDVVSTAFTATGITNVTGVTVTNVEGADDTGDLVSTAFTAGALTNVTGVTITNVEGADGTGDLVYTHSGTLLAYGGGTGVDVSSDGDYELKNADESTTVSITVVALSLPGGDQTDAGVAVTIPTLTFSGGTAVDIIGDGDYELKNADESTTVSITVVSASLASSNQTDAGVAVTVPTLAFGGGTAVEIAGDGDVELENSGATATLFVTVVSADLANSDQTDAGVAFTVAKLKIGDGDNVVIDEDGDYALVAADAATFTATVTYDGLAESNKSDELEALGIGNTLQFNSGVITAIPSDGSYTLVKGKTHIVVTVDVSELPESDTADTITLASCHDFSGNYLLGIDNLA